MIPFLVHIILFCSIFVSLPMQSIILQSVFALLASYAIIALFCVITRKSRYHVHLIHAMLLFFYFHYELFVSSLKVLKDIITPGQGSKPGFIALPLEAKTDAEIFFTANLISLTPGTLSIDISPDHQTLYIHAMFIDDISTTIASLKKFESIILKVFR